MRNIKKEMRKWNDWFIKADKQLYDEKKKLKRPVN